MSFIEVGISLDTGKKPAHHRAKMGRISWAESYILEASKYPRVMFCRSFPQHPTLARVLVIKKVPMVVRTQSKGRTITGLHVGVTNARRYFPKGTPAVDLFLDHLQIQCALKPEFWDGEADITDPRLSAWLEAKHPQCIVNRQPVAMDLVPAGNNAFRLQPVPAHHAKVVIPQNAA